MICLLLIMAMIFTNSTIVSTEQRHSDISLKEEEMNAKTKAWLLMVESGKVDQEELRRITPKSIFIAPLLTNQAGMCKEGYRHDHLGRCVKVIKIDPKVQLELLLQRLNKLYSEKKEEKEEEEVFEVSSGPLQFSLPISDLNDKVDPTKNVTEFAAQSNNVTVNSTVSKIENVPEFIPMPLPMMLLNRTNGMSSNNQTKEIESSGAEPLSEPDSYATSQIEGSGAETSGDDPLEEETTTETPITLMFEETEFLDAAEMGSTTDADFQTTTQPPAEENSTEEESYHTFTDILKVNSSVVDLPNETVPVQKVFVKNNSDKIIFPTNDNYKTSAVSSVQSSRIRFPDEVPYQPPSYQPPPELNSRFTKHKTSAVPQEEFWWLPKNWEVDKNQRKSVLVEVWSRLPLMHDITYSRDAPRERKKSLEQFSPYHGDDQFSFSINQHQPVSPRPFESHRQNYKNQR